jgi:hypothetical protein
MIACRHVPIHWQSIQDLSSRGELVLDLLFRGRTLEQVADVDDDVQILASKGIDAFTQDNISLIQVGCTGLISDDADSYGVIMASDACGSLTGAGEHETGDEQNCENALV